MLIFMHAPPSGGIGAKDDTDDYTDIFESENARLLSMLVGRDLLILEREYKTDASTDAEVTKEPPEVQSTPSAIQVTSVYFQEFSSLSNLSLEHPVWHAFGKEVIHKGLRKCMFWISPGAFFLVNTEGV